MASLVARSGSRRLWTLSSNSILRCRSFGLPRGPPLSMAGEGLSMGPSAAAAAAGRSMVRPRSTLSTSRRSKSTVVPPFGDCGSKAYRGTGAMSPGAAGGVPTSAATGGGREVLSSLRNDAFLLRPRTLPIPRWISPKKQTITLSECFGHSSFILVAASYATDDWLMLRSIAVVGSSAMLVFTYFHPHGRVLWLPFKWNLLFIAINSYRIGRVMYQRFLSEMLPDDMKRIRDDHLYVVEPVEFAKLVQAGTLVTYAPGDLVVQQGDMNRFVHMIVEGELEIMCDGQVTYRLEEGSFASESGLHAGIYLRGAVESCATIVAARDRNRSTRIRLLRWDRDGLVDLLNREKGLRRSLKAALSWDIIRKLKGQRVMLASGEVQNPEQWTNRRSSQNVGRYAAILQNILSDPEQLRMNVDQLANYREIHHIDDDRHRQALERCGWTPEEFNTGYRTVNDGDDSNDDEDFDPKQDWKNKASTAVAKILG